MLVQHALSTQVDYRVKKLYGRSMFYLLLCGLLEGRVSLGSLEYNFSSPRFKAIFHLDRDARTRSYSISDSLSMMDEDYFRQTYELLYQDFLALSGHEEGMKCFYPQFNWNKIAKQFDCFYKYSFEYFHSPTDSQS